MAKKIAARDRTRSKPLTLAALEEYGALGGFAAPQGDFDPDDRWKHAYRLWLVASGRLAPQPTDMHYRGLLEIRREPLPEGKTVTLAVRQSILQQTPGVHETTVQMTCANDPLASPRSWKLTHSVRDANLRPMPEAELNERGNVSSGPGNKATVQIEHGDHTTTFEAPLPLTANWSLFDAVQRMPQREGPPAKFAMLQECDLLKPSQQLTYRGVGQHALGGNSARLHHWQHVGEGILPYDYYTDAEGRLLVALSGLRAYIFDPNVPQLHKECLEAIARRATS